MRNFDASDMLKRLPEQFFAKLTKKVHHLSKQGYDVINLGQGNPDMPTPSHIVEALKKASENPVYHKYPPFQGYDFLKEAVAEFYKREYNVSLDAHKEIAILFGAKTGLVELSQCLLNSGDLALLPDPGYPDYLSGIALAKAETEMMPLRKENNFLPDYSKVEYNKLDRAKLMFLNYPNNPTAAVANESLFEETVKVAKQHHICVVHDFAYGALGFDEKKPQSFLQTKGSKDIGVEIYTMSKSYNMAGWRIAFAVGNQSVVQHINLLQDHMYVSLFGGIQKAAAHALLGDQEEVKQLITTYEKRRNTFIHCLRRIGWEVEMPQGTFFAWLPVPKGYSSEQFCDLLVEKAHVVMAPGNGFGSHGEGYVRAGLLDSETRLEEAAERIGKLDLF